MNQRQPLFYAFFSGFLALVIASAVATPRFLAFGPGIAGLVFSILYIRRDKGKLAWPREALTLVLPVLGVGFVSALWALAPGEVMTRTGRLSLVVMSGVLLIALVRAVPLDKLRPKLWLVPAAVVLAAGLTAFDLGFHQPLYRLMRLMPFSEAVPHAVYNRGAVAVTLCLFPAWALLRLYWPKRKALGLFALTVLPMAVMIESQSAQLALLLGVLFATCFPYSRRWAWFVLTGGIGAYITLFPFIAPWAFTHLAAPLSTLPFLHEGFAGPRLEIWDYVSRYALHRPLTGYGLEACRVITDFDSAQIYQPGTSILHPHNFALQLWIEFGALGAALGTGFFAYLLHLIRTRLDLDQMRVALPTLVTALSVGSTGYGVWQGWWIGLLCLAAALCVLACKPDARPVS